jgi:hypothetical protein
VRGFSSPSAPKGMERISMLVTRSLCPVSSTKRAPERREIGEGDRVRGGETWGQK